VSVFGQKVECLHLGRRSSVCSWAKSRAFAPGQRVLRVRPPMYYVILWIRDSDLVSCLSYRSEVLRYMGYWVVGLQVDHVRHIWKILSLDCYKRVHLCIYVVLHPMNRGKILSLSTGSSKTSKMSYIDLNGKQT
jgi:hypothetical protein